MRSRLFFSIIGVFALSLILAWIATGYQSFQGWTSFLAITILGVGILIIGWWAIIRDPRLRPKQSIAKFPIPIWLGWLLIGAAILRLGAGVFWFTALPKLGYGGEVEVAGYVMSDAYKRDTAAWELSQTEKPLLAAFTGFRGADQYGGMLFGSALVYRYLGGNTHQPMLIIVLTAAFSALAVLLTWAFTRRLWDSKSAAIAAWIVAIFPDAVLLGSAQMREAFMMLLVMLAFYNLVCTWHDHSKGGLAWIVLVLFVAVPLSPLFALMLGGMLGVFFLFLGGYRWLKDWRIWAVLLGLIALSLITFFVFGEQFIPGGASNPVAVLQLWLKQAARWQAYNSENASGWMQQIFRSTPDWTHSWLLISYGIARPFLPAALFDPGALIWQGIAIWRSLGWAALLPFLILGPFLAWRKDGWLSPAMGLSILVWTGILIASFRAGGDAWDNPRYRVTWIGIQATVAAWVWVTQQKSGSPWLRRILIAVGLILLWFMPWYFDRMTPFEWPVKDVFFTLGLALLSALVYGIVDIWLTHRKNATTK